MKWFRLTVKHVPWHRMLKKRTKKNVEENEGKITTSQLIKRFFTPNNQHKLWCELKVDRSQAKVEYYDDRSKEKQTENFVVTLFSSVNK